METKDDGGAARPHHANVTGTIVDFLENRGVQTYAFRRSPSSIILSLPNEPESSVERHVEALRGELQQVQFERQPDVVSRDPRDVHAILIEIKPPRGEHHRDAIVRVLRNEESELRRRGVDRLTLFGSTATLKPHPNDVDLLVRFRPGLRVSAFDIAELQGYLEDKLGRRVDLSTDTAFSSDFKKRVEQTGIGIFGS